MEGKPYRLARDARTYAAEELVYAVRAIHAARGLLGEIAGGEPIAIHLKFLARELQGYGYEVELLDGEPADRRGEG